MTEIAESANAESAEKKKSSLLTRLAPVAVLVALVGIFFLNGWHNELALERLVVHQANFESFIAENLFVSVGAFIVAYITLTALSIPGASIMTILGGVFFGLWVGTISVLIGATIGATVIFMVVRTALGDALAKKAGGFIKKLEQGFREDELSYMFILRLVPLFPFFVVNIAAGVLGVKLRNYVIASFIGMAPATFVYVSIGNTTKNILQLLIESGACNDAKKAAEAAGETFTEVCANPLAGALAQPSAYVPIIGLIVLSLIPIAYKRMKRQGDVPGAEA
ncbi:MAG: TVP38/TMEM64 family protein [Maricaulaceae bacterium]